MRLAKAFDSAAQNLSRSQLKSKERFDKIRKATDFEVGDIVVYDIPIRRKGQPDKLQAKAKGPYKIVSKLGDL
jgi:hypothetical protein